MLKRTFCHIPKIGLKTEESLWAEGVRDWGALSESAGHLLPESLARAIQAHLKLSARQLSQNDPQFFAQSMPHSEHWRLFAPFRQTVAYLDIETNGLSVLDNYITTIALYDGRQIKHYVRGRNLDEFPSDIRRYKVLVTFNGKCFDVPFIEYDLNTTLQQTVLDLRFILKSLGYRGGLKHVEKTLGIDRGLLAGVDGWCAVYLWKEFAENGDERALETLLAYNIEDVVNLERLMVRAYNLKLAQTPFEHELTLPEPALPRIPFRPDADLLDRIKRNHTPAAAASAYIP